MWGGVPILFTLCGFLVMGSYEKSKNTGEYFKKRFLRIFPPLWFSVWVGYFILWAFLGEAFPVWKAAMWTFLQGFALQYTPSFAEGFGSGTFNGALWALFTEIQFYLIVPVFYRVMRKKGIKCWITVGILLLTIQVLGTQLTKEMDSRALSLIWKRCILSQSNYFFIGSFLYVYRDSLLKGIIRYCPLLVLSYATIYVINCFVNTGLLGLIVVECLLPVLIITLGFYLGDHHLKYDVSYGIYLFHVMIINIFIELNIRMNIGVALMILLISCACGFASLLIDKCFRKALT